MSGSNRSSGVGNTRTKDPGEGPAHPIQRLGQDMRRGHPTHTNPRDKTGEDGEQTWWTPRSSEFDRAEEPGMSSSVEGKGSRHWFWFVLGDIGGKKCKSKNA